jgi:hypothetical protein
VRRDDVASLREGPQIDLSSPSQEQIDHSTALLADEVIVPAGLGIEPGPLFIQEEGADLPLLDETVQVAVNGGETDSRQFSVNPPVDLVGERVRVIALESREHLLQLTGRTLAGRSPHRPPLPLPRIQGFRTERTSVAAGYQMPGPLSRAFQ